MESRVRDYSFYATVYASMNHSRPSDYLKGSYYANIIVQESTISEAQKVAYPEYYGSNICKSLYHAT
jgi:hypothetical protein